MTRLGHGTREKNGKSSFVLLGEIQMDVIIQLENVFLTFTCFCVYF